MVLSGGAKGVGRARHKTARVGLNYVGLPVAIVAACALLAGPSGSGPEHEGRQKETHEGASNISIQDSAAVVVAHYTRTLAWFTAVLAFVGIAQGLMFAWQIRLARQEFISTHRPRIRVRHVFNLSHNPDDRVVAQIVMVNVGDSPAKIKGFTASILPVRKASEGWVGVEDEETLDPKPLSEKLNRKSGERYVRVVQKDFTTDDLNQNGRFEMCVIGAVSYVDANHTERRTGFYWEVSRRDPVFRRIEGSAYDYED